VRECSYSGIILVIIFIPQGLRGAIAFALSLHLEFEQEKRYVLVTATLIIVLFTIFFLGGMTLPMMKVMDS
jgi:sodium/hydrogen exchanger 8